MNQQLAILAIGTVRIMRAAAGYGLNLRHFRRDTVYWIGVEANLFMERYLREERQ